jgi:23S rRNA (adenine1618-N6)-methyltransferase
MHPRNRHQGHYDFPALIGLCPPLAECVVTNPVGASTIDFANPHSVRMLNRALLQQHYRIAHWDLPDAYLCPPVPGRADYIHVIADLLALDHGAVIPRGLAIAALDIGVGANGIYPFIGHQEYGWRFVGTEISTDALAVAQSNISNNQLDSAISLRLQRNRGQIFRGVVNADDRFAVSLCNPPFHGSAKEALAARRQKWAGLQRADSGFNFGGHDAELWCTGGEASFIKRMVQESASFGSNIVWFTTLVARSVHLPALQKRLQQVGAAEIHTKPMAQGQKQSRVLAWSFLTGEQRHAAIRNMLAS